MLAALHSEGVVPVVSDVVNIYVKIGAISSAHSLRIYVEILSGPFAFLGSRLFSNFCTPLTSIVSSLMRGAGGVRGHDILVRSSFVNILSYCLLSASDFSLPVVISLPSTFSTGIPVVSLRFVLTQDQNFLLILNFEQLSFPSVVSRIPLIYLSWLLTSSCLTNLLNSLNVSQSSGVPELFGFVIPSFLFPYESFNMSVDPRCVPSSAYCLMRYVFFSGYSNDINKLVIHFVS